MLKAILKAEDKILNSPACYDFTEAYQKGEAHVAELETRKENKGLKFKIWVNSSVKEIGSGQWCHVHTVHIYQHDPSVSYADLRRRLNQIEREIIHSEPYILDDPEGQLNHQLDLWKREAAELKLRIAQL